jgi:hypothetical protein
MDHLICSGKHNFNFMSPAYTALVSLQTPVYKRLLDDYHPRIKWAFSAASMTQPFSNSYMSMINPLRNDCYDWIDGLAQRLARTIPKFIDIKGFSAITPTLVSLPILKAKTTQMMMDIECRYVPNGCHARSLLLSKKIDQEFCGPVSLSITLQSNQSLQATCGDFHGVHWSYHIAAAVLADNGFVYVLDPVINSQQPVELVDWIKEFEMGEYCYLRIGIADEFQVIDGQKISALKKAQEMCSQHQLKMMDFDNTFQPPFNEGSVVQIVPHYAYVFDSKCEMRYSFSKPLAAIFENHDIVVDLNLLTYQQRNSQESETLFYFQHGVGESVTLDRNEVIYLLSEMQAKRFEILMVPCNVNSPECLRIIE